MKFSYSTRFKSSIKVLFLLCVALLTPIQFFFISALFMLDKLRPPLLWLLLILGCVVLLSVPILALWHGYRKLAGERFSLIVTNQGVEFNFFEIGRPFCASWNEIESIERKDKSIRIIPRVLSGKKKKPLNLFDQFNYALDQIYETLLQAKQGQLREEPVESFRKIVNQAYQKRTMFYHYSVIAITFLLLASLMVTELVLKSGGYSWIFTGLIVVLMLSFIISARFDSKTFSELTLDDSHLIIECVAFRSMRRKRFANITIPIADIDIFNTDNRMLVIKTKSENYSFTPVEFSKTDRLYLQDNLFNKL